MARTRAVPRWRPNINFQQRGNVNFERQRVAATRNISSSESSSSSSAAASPPTQARSPLGNLARNLAEAIGRNPQSNSKSTYKKTYKKIRRENKICFTKSQRRRGKTQWTRRQKNEGSKSCNARC